MSRPAAAGTGAAPIAPRLAFDPGPVLFAGAVVVLAVLVIVPLGWLLVISLQRPDAGGFTTANYVEAFTNAIYLRPILNSLILATSVATIASLLGTPLAWLVARTDLPGRRQLRALIMAAFVTPSFIGAEAWILLAAPNSGWINRAIVSATHATHGPLNIFSLGGAIFVMALYNVPYTFTFVAGALELLPVELEDASSTLGASAWRTMRSVTLPLVLPAILAGFIMSFLEAIAEFGSPAFLLIPARAQVVTTQLYLFFQFPVRTELAAAYAMPLLAATLLLLILQRRVLGRRRFTMVGGKGGRRREIALGRWRGPLLAAALMVPLCSVVLPYLALLATSLSRIWSDGPVPGNLTLYWYRWAILDNAETRRAIGHSLAYGAAAATVATLVALLIAYTANRRLFPGAQTLGIVCMAPFVVPGIVLAIGIYAAYSRPPLLLYGSAAILIIAFTTRFLPIAYSNLNTMIAAINVDLENAARTLGATRIRTLRTVTAPLLRRGLLASWLLVFIPAIRELSSAIFLFTPRTATMTTQIFDFSDAGNYEGVSTLAILILVITLIIVSVAYRFLGKDFMEKSSA
ncbi:MAG: iron ABC transporter permease [Candidatus Eremiobacteraeota bacterium]|nr:iron ABC transporter permease [Candidatus Eremiobacteraeota bacterium]